MRRCHHRSVFLIGPLALIQNRPAILRPAARASEPMIQCNAPVGVLNRLHLRLVSITTRLPRHAGGRMATTIARGRHFGRKHTRRIDRDAARGHCPRLTCHITGEEKEVATCRAPR